MTDADKLHDLIRSFGYTTNGQTAELVTAITKIYPKPERTELGVSETMKVFLKDVIGVVEATSYETSCLWKEYHQGRKKTWVQGLGGYLPTIGLLGDRPVVLSLLVNTVDGHPILFMEATSQVVDHQMIEDWLKRHLPATALKDDGKYVNKVDSNNFDNVFPRG